MIKNSTHTHSGELNAAQARLVCELGRACDPTCVFFCAAHTRLSIRRPSALVETTVGFRLRVGRERDQPLTHCTVRFIGSPVRDA